jgi:hypothetical protein
MEASPGGESPSRKAGAGAAAVGVFLLAVVAGAMVAVFRTMGTAGEVTVSVAASFVVPIALILTVGGIVHWRKPKRSRAMVDPVLGTLLVTGSHGDPAGAVYASCHLTGVLTGPGVPATAVTHDGYVRSAKWPAPGAILPVIVDRVRPRRFEVQWDQVGTGHQLALRQAEQIAARMRAAADSTQPLSGFEAVRGMPVLPAGAMTTAELRAALRQDGAPGRAVIDQVRPGGQTADGQEFHLDVWLQMDSGVSMRQELVPVAVPADQVAKVVPGRIVPVRVGVVDDVLVTAYQWELL